MMKHWAREQRAINKIFHENENNEKEKCVKARRDDERASGQATSNERQPEHN